LFTFYAFGSTVEFENGTKATFALGTSPSITLPLDEDVDGNGSVDFRIDYAIEARFNNFMNFKPRFVWGSRQGYVKAEVYTNTEEPELVGVSEHGPISIGGLFQATGQLLKCVGTTPEKLFSNGCQPDGSTMIGEDKGWILGDTLNIIVEDSFLLPGFNVPGMRGRLDLMQ
jgi:hypothetical protein